MLSARNFNPSLLAKVAVAMQKATAVSAQLQIGAITVKNRNGEVVLSVRHVRHPLSMTGFEFLDAQQIDITSTVLGALRRMT